MIRKTITEIEIILNTKKNLFSPNYVDAGTRAMLQTADVTGGKILDLGCGYGVVAIYYAKKFDQSKIFAIDSDPEAISCTQENILLNNTHNITAVQSDGFKNFFEKDFDCILCNPPYHTDFSVAKHFIEKGFNRLAINGKMFFVTKRREWYKNKLISVFGGVKITEFDGYFIFAAEKKSMSYSSVKPQK